MTERYYQYNPIDFLCSEEEIRIFLSEVEAEGNVEAIEEARSLVAQARKKIKNQNGKYFNVCKSVSKITTEVNRTNWGCLVYRQLTARNSFGHGNVYW